MTTTMAEAMTKAEQTLSESRRRRGIAARDALLTWYADQQPAPSFAWISRASGISPSSVSALLNEKRIPAATVVRQINAFLRRMALSPYTPDKDTVFRTAIKPSGHGVNYTDQRLLKAFMERVAALRHRHNDVAPFGVGASTYSRIMSGKMPRYMKTTTRRAITAYLESTDPMRASETTPPVVVKRKARPTVTPVEEAPQVTPTAPEREVPREDSCWMCAEPFEGRKQHTIKLTFDFYGKPYEAEVDMCSDCILETMQVCS